MDNQTMIASPYRFGCGLLASLVLGAACSVSPVEGLPSEFTDVPWGAGDVHAATVLRARGLDDRDEPGAALALLDDVLEVDPRHVDALRVRQDVLRRRGRHARVRVEADERVASWPPEAAHLAAYLRGRIEVVDDGKRRWFERSLELDDRGFWGWLGLAFTQRRTAPQDAVAIYRALYERTGGHPLVAIALAAALRESGKHDDALRLYDGLRGNPGFPGIGELGMAETYIATERWREGWAPMLAALRLRPFDAGVRRLLQLYASRGLPDDQLDQLLERVWDDDDRVLALAQGGGRGLLGRLFERAGNLAYARELFESDPDVLDSCSIRERREWRRLLLATGDVRGYLTDLAKTVPSWLLDDERNQVRGRWIALLRGPWLVGSDDAGPPAEPLADPEHAVEIVDALVRVGLLDAADTVATLALARHRDETAVADALVSLRDESRRERAFEGALRRVLYRGYGANEEPPDLETVLGELRRVSTELLGDDVVGSPELFDVPFVGRLVNPFSAGLGQHLARYNKHLVLGQRDGRPPEGLLLTRLALDRLEDEPALPVPGETWRVVGDRRQIQSLQAVLGGDLAGIALLNHYVIDMDAVRDWAANLRLQREIVREDGDALLDDPLPDDVDPLDPLDVAWRLAALSPVPDEELDRVVLEMICWHERAHLVDSFHFLPPERNLFRVLGLVFGHAFDPLAIESEMEGRAEHASLVLSRDPRLVLAHIASFLERPVVGSPHASGFRTLAARLNDGLRARPEHAANAAVSRWHLVPPETLRQIARERLAYWR